MKAKLYSWGIVLVVAALSALASADPDQHPLVEDTNAIPDAINDDIIPDFILDDLDKDPVPPPIWKLCGNPSKHLLIPYITPSPGFCGVGLMGSDKNGVTIEPAQPVVGENITVTIKGQVLKRVTSGTIDVDLRLMKFIKLTPTFDLCEQLEGDLFAESNVSCPLEKGPVTLIAKKLIPDDVPKVSVQGNITLTNQDGETLTCMGPLGGLWTDCRCAY